jgi:GT2 family glycosyltransferase
MEVPCGGSTRYTYADERQRRVTIVSTITVVVRTYESARFLSSALASIAGQSRAPDVVVVVDDASTDESVEIAQAWAGRLPLEIVEHKENQGPSAALRTGISKTTTDLITDLDADDVWFPDHLETLEMIWQDLGGIVSADAINWVPGTALASQSWYQKHPAPPRERQLRELARRNWVFSSVLLERNDYERVGGYRDLTACEDWDLWLRLLDAGTPVHVSSHATMLYRQHTASVSKGLNASVAANDLLREFASQTRDSKAASIARRSARVWRGHAAVYRSLDLARAGHRWEARRAALRGLGGIDPATRALALLVAPNAARRVHDRLVSDPRRLVEH